MYQLAPGKIQRDTPSDYAALTFKELNACLKAFHSHEEKKREEEEEEEEMNERIKEASSILNC